MVLDFDDYMYASDSLRALAAAHTIIINIDENSNINESKVKSLLNIGANWADLFSQFSGKAADVFRDPSQITDIISKGNVMNKKDFKKFVESYIQIYKNLSQDFIEDNQDYFDVINDVIEKYSNVEKLGMELEREQSRIKTRKEQTSYKDVIRKTQEKTKKFRPSKAKRK